ncbi:Protein of unknown function [Bacillus wiedmannii]|jgi:hypothetical protein
MKLC